MPDDVSGASKARRRHLIEAVDDAHYLLAYFSRVRVNVPADKAADFKSAIDTLSSFHAVDDRTDESAAVDGLQHEPPTGDQRAQGNAPQRSKDPTAEFWKAFILLSDLAYPATVESIRYYFNIYYPDTGNNQIKSAKYGADRPGSKFLGRKIAQRSPFVVLTFFALFMAVGLSLVSYVGTKALLGYDADYAHWAQVQTITRALDEGGRLEFTTAKAAAVAGTNDVGDELHVLVKLPGLGGATQGGQTTPNVQTQVDGGAVLAGKSGVQSAALRDVPVQTSSQQKGDASSDKPTVPEIEVDLTVPKVSETRVHNLLLDAHMGDRRTTDVAYSCTRILDLFAKVRHDPPGASPPSGALTQDRCRDLLTGVKPHVMMIADDLTFTFASIVTERTTLQHVLAIVRLPLDVFHIVGDSLSWIGDKVKYGFSSAANAASNDAIKPHEGINPQEFVDNPIDAFNLFVLLQQEHAPIPVLLPLPSVEGFADVFDARVAVAIVNTYLATLAFGFLGACVRVLREINTNLERFTLAPSQFARYRAKILLGMVSGPTVGLFFDQNGHFLSFTTASTQLPSLSTQLSACAIAFIAGFSIEILFAIMDRFIRIIQDFAGATNSNA